MEKKLEKLEKLEKKDLFEKLLFSIRMLHFHNYINDTQFSNMIHKLSDEISKENN